MICFLIIGIKCMFGSLSRFCTLVSLSFFTGVCGECPMLMPYAMSEIIR